MKKLILSLVLIVVCTAAPAIACSGRCWNLHGPCGQIPGVVTGMTCMDSDGDGPEPCYETQCLLTAADLSGSVCGEQPLAMEALGGVCTAAKEAAPISLITLVQ